MLKRHGPMILALVAVALAASSYLASFTAIEGRAERPPLMDPASHGVDGVLLAKAVRDLDPGTFFYRLYNRMNLWPPGYRLMQAPFYFFFGYEYLVGRLLLNGVYVLAAFAVFFVGAQLWSAVPWFAGLVGALLFMMAPQSQAMANMIMLELPGIFLLCLGLGFYLRALRQRAALEDPTISLRLSFAIAAILFLTKYNFGILLLVPIVAYEFLREPRLRVGAADLVRRFFAEGHWRHPFAMFCFVYLLVLIQIRYLGGFEFELFGEKVVARRKIGNPTYFLIVVVAGFFAWRNRLTFAKAKAAFSAWPTTVQLFAVYVGLPLFVWFANPLNWHAFLSFITNESKTERFLVDNFFFYTKVFGTDFVPGVVVGYLMLGLAATGLIFWRRYDQATRFFYAFTLLNFLLVVAHHHQGPRYIMIVTPLLMLSAAHALSTWLGRLANDFVAGVLATILALGLVAYVARQEKPDPQVQGRFLEHSLSAEHRSVFQAICDKAAGYDKTHVLGLWNLFSQGTLSWECWNGHPEMSFAQTPRLPTRSELDRSAPDWQSFVEGPEAASLFVFVEYLDRHPQHDEIAGWSLPFLNEASSMPRLMPLAQLDFPAVSYRLHFFERRP